MICVLFTNKTYNLFYVTKVTYKIKQIIHTNYILKPNKVYITNKVGFNDF